MPRDEISAVYAKIEALLNRTTDNGCSENEAASAAFLVQQLLTKYNLELKDVKFKEKQENRVKRGHSQYHTKIKFRRFDWVVDMALGVSHLCYCQIYQAPSQKLIQWLGEEQDICVAGKMLDWLVDQAFQRCKFAWAEGKNREFRHMSYLPFENAFLAGYGDAMYHKLMFIVKERERSVEGVPGLVVDKRAQIDEFLEAELAKWNEKYGEYTPKTRSRRRAPKREKTYRYDERSHSAGQTQAKETHVDPLESLEA